jgi:hypothetical protein
MVEDTHESDELAREGSPASPSEPTWQREPARRPSDPNHTIAGRGAAARFVGRVAQLDLAAVQHAVATWRQRMRVGYDGWFAAEDAVAQAIVRSGRQIEQRPLLIHMADAFSQRVWTGGHRDDTGAAEQLVRATEASGQYLATLAMLALLVRDHLDAATFDRVYEPFAALIPIKELAPE